MGLCKKPPVRFWIATMIFMTTFINYMGRVHMSLCIISMVTEKSGKIHVAECLKDNQSGNQTNNSTQNPKHDYGPRYAWDENIQGLVLAGYFYGYMFSCLPAGVIAEWWGPKNVILYTSLLQGIFTALTAPAAFLHWTVVFSCRFVIGVLGGLTYPAVHCLIAHWAPPAEKGKFLAALMGNTLGTVMTWPLVGIVTETWGWPWGFYVLAMICFLFCFIFVFLTSDSPDKHKWISEEERNFIVESRQGTVSAKKTIPPYWEILKSVPFWALAFAQFGNLWGMYLIATGIPKFISEVLGFNLKKSGFLSALPYLARLIFGLFFGWLGDFIKRRELMSFTMTRKCFTIFSHLLPSAMLYLIILVGCNWKAAVSFIIFCQGFNGAVVITHLMNPQDLAPNFAGTLNGMMCFFGGISGFVVPSVTGALIYKHNGLHEWHINFVIGGTVYGLCGVIFIVFGTGQLQLWNEKSVPSGN